MATAKNSSNVFIGIGYLFAATLILINYLSKEPDGKYSDLGTQRKGILGTSSSVDETEILKKHLEEERRINREMRKMLEKMQMCVGAGLSDIKSYASGQMRLSTFEIEKMAHEGLPSLGNVEMRCLNSKKSSCQFKNIITTTCKNPFIPFYQEKKVKLLTKELPTEINISADPMIPLIIQSSCIPVKVYSSLE